MNKKCKLQKKNTQVFYCLTGGRIKPPVDKSWVSLCSPVHREYINLCFISIHERISKLQTLVYVALTKEFTDDHIFSECAFLLEHRSMAGTKPIPWWMRKFMANTMSEESIPYAIVSVSYDGLCKRL